MPVVKNKPSRRPAFIDIAFGNAELIRRFAGAKTKDGAAKNRVIEGVESPSVKKKTKARGARLSYKGFLQWLVNAKPGRYTLVNADFFFNNYCEGFLKKKGKLVEFANGDREAEEMLRVELIGKLRMVQSKLVPGGFLVFSLPARNAAFIKSLLRKAGFSTVGSRRLRKEERVTQSQKEHYSLSREIPGHLPVRIVARKPRA